MSIRLLEVRDAGAFGRFVLVLDVEGERVTTSAEVWLDEGEPTIDFADRYFDVLLVQHAWLSSALAELLDDWSVGEMVPLPHTLEPPDYSAPQTESDEDSDADGWDTLTARLKRRTAYANRHLVTESPRFFVRWPLSFLLW